MLKISLKGPGGNSIFQNQTLNCTTSVFIPENLRYISSYYIKA